MSYKQSEKLHSIECTNNLLHSCYETELIGDGWWWIIGLRAKAGWSVESCLWAMLNGHVQVAGAMWVRDLLPVSAAKRVGRLDPRVGEDLRGWLPQDRLLLLQHPSPKWRLVRLQQLPQTRRCCQCDRGHRRRSTIRDVEQRRSSVSCLYAWIMVLIPCHIYVIWCMRLYESLYIVVPFMDHNL